MSEVTANISLTPISATFIVDNNNINLTPEATQLTIINGYAGVSGYSGISGWSGVSGIGTSGYSGAPAPSGYSGKSGYSGRSGDPGGTSGYSGFSGAGVGGTNTQIQFNDGGVAAGASGFTFDKTSNVANFPGNVNITGITSIREATEKITNNSGGGATGTVNFDVLTQGILYNSVNALNNFTLNIRGNSTVLFNTVVSSNQSMTLRFINTNGVAGYYANVITIDGTTVTPKWVFASGPPTSGIPSGCDVYDFNILKIAANTYSIFSSKVGYQ